MTTGTDRPGSVVRSLRSWRVAADITGLRDAVWFDVVNWRFRRPTPDAHRRLFMEDVHGGTLAYRRNIWDRGGRYPDLSLAEDAWFLRNAVRCGARLERLAASGVYAYVRHGANSWRLAAHQDVSTDWDDIAEPPELGTDRSFYAARSSRAPTAPQEWIATVSCIVPTADRHDFLPAAIGCFLGQRFDAAELLIVDDGHEPVEHLVPDDPRIRYIRLEGHRLLGDKRNLAVDAAHGDVIVHFDDDDWSHPDRVRTQFDTLATGAGELCGLSTMLWWDPQRRTAWRYTCPPMRRPWVAGNTLAYLRSAWQRAPFPAQTLGEDTAFVWGLPTRHAVPIDDERLVIGTLHDRNTSSKRTAGSSWTPVDALEVLRMFESKSRKTI